MLIPILSFAAAFVVFAVIAVFKRDWEYIAFGFFAGLLTGFIGLMVAFSIGGQPPVNETYTVSEWAKTDLTYTSDRVVVVQDENERVEVNRVLPGEGLWSLYDGQVNTVTYFLENP